MRLFCIKKWDNIIVIRLHLEYVFGVTIKGGPKMAGRLRPNCRTIYIIEHTPNAGTVESQKFRGGGTSIIEGHLSLIFLQTQGVYFIIVL